MILLKFYIFSLFANEVIEGWFFPIPKIIKFGAPTSELREFVPPKSSGLSSLRGASDFREFELSRLGTPIARELEPAPSGIIWPEEGLEGTENRFESPMKKIWQEKVLRGTENGMKKPTPDDEQVTTNRYLMTDLFEEFIQQLKKSDTPSTRALADKFLKDFSRGAAENKGQWLSTWIIIQADFVKAVNQDSQDWEPGMRVINRAILTGEQPEKYHLNNGNISVPSAFAANDLNVSRILDYEFESNDTVEESGDELRTQILTYLAESGQLEKYFLDKEFCLDFASGRIRIEFRGRMIFYKLPSLTYENTSQSISNKFINFLSVQNPALRNLTEKYSRELKCKDAETVKNWSNIWEGIKNDLVENIDPNTEGRREALGIIERALQELHPIMRPSSNKPASNYKDNYQQTSKQEQNPTDYSSLWDLFAAISVTITIAVIYIIIKRIIYAIKSKSSSRQESDQQSSDQQSSDQQSSDHKSSGHHFQIDFKQLTIMDQLGTGNFSNVYLVAYQPKMSSPSSSFRLMAAAKLLTPEILVEDDEVEPSVLAASVACSVDEIKIRKLKHTNIVRIYGLCTNFAINPKIPTTGLTLGMEVKSCITIATIFEYMDLGNLEKYLPKHCNISKSPMMASRYLQRLILILIDVTDAFFFLNGQKIVHRDLAARNVLLQRRYRKTPQNIMAKVGDFGLAKTVNNYASLTNGVIWAHIGKKTESLDREIMAPESIRKFLYTSLSDVYAFGILIINCVVLMKGTKQETTSAVLDVHRHADATVLSMDDNVTNVHAQPESLEVSISDTVYSPVNLVSTEFPSVKNILGETTINLSSPATCDADVQKIIDQLLQLASSCLKSNLEERITFKKLGTKLHALMIKCPRARGES